MIIKHPKKDHAIFTYSRYASVFFTQDPETISISINCCPDCHIRGRVDRKHSFNYLEHRLKDLTAQAINEINSYHTSANKTYDSIYQYLQAVANEWLKKTEDSKGLISYYSHLPSIDALIQSVIKVTITDQTDVKLLKHIKHAPLIIMLKGTPAMRKRLLHNIHVNNLDDCTIKRQAINFAQIPCLKAEAFYNIVRYVSTEVRSVRAGNGYQVSYQLRFEHAIKHNAYLNLALQALIKHKLARETILLNQVPVTVNGFLSCSNHSAVFSLLLTYLKTLDCHDKRINLQFLAQRDWVIKH